MVIGKEGNGGAKVESSCELREAATSAMPSRSRFGTGVGSSVSLRHRLPWLDNRTQYQAHTSTNSDDRKPALLASESQTRLLPMTDVTSQLRDEADESAVGVGARTPPSVRPEPSVIQSNTVSRDLHPSSGHDHQEITPPPVELSSSGGQLQQPKTFTFCNEMDSTTVEIPILRASPRRHYTVETVGSTRCGVKPTSSSDTTTSLHEFDASPLTRAIQRIESLMKEAEGLFEVAADGRHPDVTEHLMDAEKQVGQTSRTVATKPAMCLTKKSELSGGSSICGHSADESNMHGANSREAVHRARTREPVVKYFQYLQAKGLEELDAGLRVDYQPTITPDAVRCTPNSLDSCAPTPLHDMHTAYISESQSSDTPASVVTLRKRALHAEIVDYARPDWHEWCQPRQNTSFDTSWTPNDNYKPSNPRKSSIAPVPWNERNHRARSGNVKFDLTKTTRDVEKAGTTSDSEGGVGLIRKHWTLGHAKDEPIARRWKPMRKRISAVVACLNTGMVGYAIGDYAGMVPRIQFQLADQKHDVLLGNVFLFLGMAVTTFFCWPLPLLHGRRPYVLVSLGLAIPLQFPQAILVSQFRTPIFLSFEFGLLTCRFLTGLLLGLTNINDFAMLLDVFGASLQSECPHQELVTSDDLRREGGGIGVWLGIWAWCWVGSVSVGFMSGAGIINNLNPQWGFYISTALMICAMVFNVMAPETRHPTLHRKIWDHSYGTNQITNLEQEIARGEIKLHIDDRGPQHWSEELWAGVVLMKRMFFQRGFCVVSLYLGWMYGQNILVIVLLGALLSRDYHLPSRYVGIGVFSIAIGALLAVPMAYAGLFSRARKQGPRTDSMTFERQVTWTSHMVRRIVFMLMLPVVAAVYTVTSQGHSIPCVVPVLFAGAIGFFQSLALAKCYGVIMETFDTSDLQPGANSRHRLQSLAEGIRNRRTDYSSFPRVSAGIFLSQSLGFLFAAAATGIGGMMTREIGAQYSTGVTMVILTFLAVMLTGVLFRFQSVQVVPNHAFGTRVGTFEMTPGKIDPYWKPVIIGSPSGKFRRMNLLEMGKLSRWSEIRTLNKLV